MSRFSLGMVALFVVAVLLPRFEGLEPAAEDVPQQAVLSDQGGRFVLVVDADNKVVHTELVGEIGDEPNYDAAIAALG